MARRGYPIVVALDQGTTGTRAVRYALRDDGLAVEGDAYREHAQHTPAPGHVEHDADEIAAAAEAVLAQVGEGADALGIANQTETLVAWDAETRRPLHRALVWQSRQGVEACDRLAPHAADLRARTGLLLDPTFSALKLAWLLEHVPAVAASAERGTLRLGTIDCWLVDRLTGGAAHVTDASNASRTLLFDLDAGAFAPDLCALVGAPVDALPAVVDSAGVVGETAAGVRDRGPARRPAGRALRPRRADRRAGQVHVRYRRDGARLHRRASPRAPGGPARDRRLAARRRHHLRARRHRLRRGRRRPLAARRPGPDRADGRRRGARGLRPGRGRRRPRARVLGARRAGLGPGGARDRHRPHRRHHPRPPGPARRSRPSPSRSPTCSG